MSPRTATAPAPDARLTAGSPAERARPGLVGHLARLATHLEAHLAGDPPAALPAPAGPEPLDRLVVALGLSPFERDVLLLAAGVELDARLADLVAQAQPGSSPQPTFALALAALPEAHWDALLPEGPLRRWGLVAPTGSGPLVTRPLALDELVLHHLTGLADGETVLDGLAAPRLDPPPLSPSQQRVAEEVAAAVVALDAAVLVRLDGADRDARLGVAAHLAAALGLELLRVRDAALGELRLSEAARTLDREAVLGDRLPLTGHAGLLGLLEARVVVADGEPADGGAGAAETPGGRTVLTRTVDPPYAGEQAALWRAALGARTAGEAGPVGRAVAELAHHYRLTARSIQAIAAEWSGTVPRAQQGTSAGAHTLRRLVRERARVGLGGLAERVEPRATWDDLVLPDGQRRLLADLAAQLAHRATVYDDWGFASRTTGGLGVTALFAGASGTGKTMAAEVIAGDLGLDLYRIDLSAVVSKYIGETEKNLRRVFDAAEAAGAVLLFDEADALFGRRSEVKDSHDRYANLEVAYLLQRMEAYRGLAILTTNLRDNVDPAFVRRIRFVVQLPFPDEAARAEIWRRAIPAQAPTEDLDLTALARLQVSGGSIRAIAVAAAFAAAAEGSAIGARHLLHAATVEYAKAERSLTAVETAALTTRRPQAVSP